MGKSDPIFDNGTINEPRERIEHVEEVADNGIETREPAPDLFEEDVVEPASDPKDVLDDDRDFKAPRQSESVIFDSSFMNSKD